ncbi:tryptophan-rich sensory protein [Alkalicoccus daliensis]|uniref:TspO and MBR related proteins n=1 Tax=Alkalicoccus daliensis TaxID=745820 RepID=A0A1H0DXW6_9BACI|nr:tryptophan-rich sensory protein [Alkalicoccus daliensis]SDN74949.1 TspO and MBR related proteins [Alkalicoccus daliensis]
MNRKFPVINLVVLVIIVGMNALANILPLNNMTTGELSQEVNVLFTPAGYVFSIWSLIYITLGIWVIRSLFTSHAGDIKAVDNIGWLFVWNGIFNVSWLLLFHYEFFPWTMLPMAALLLSIILIYRQILQAGKVSVWTKLPFAIYMGWVSVAFIVNIGILFNTFGFEDGFIISNELWTVIIIPAGGIIAAIIAEKYKDIIYSSVFVWAFIGIYVERAEEVQFIAVTAAVTAALLLLYNIIFLVRKKYILKLDG